MALKYRDYQLCRSKELKTIWRWQRKCSYFRLPVACVRREAASVAGYVSTARHSTESWSPVRPRAEWGTPPAAHSCVQSSVPSAQTWAVHDSTGHRRLARHLAVTGLQRQQHTSIRVYINEAYAAQQKTQGISRCALKHLPRSTALACCTIDSHMHDYSELRLKA